MTKSRKPKRASTGAGGKALAGNAAAAAVVQCWCGAAELSPFGPEYAECHTCGTLVLRKKPAADDLLVTDDEQDFYGKSYWLEHQQADLELPDIYSRTRTDLSERNLHWLQVLLKYRLPPARAVELGCAHGSFVALMNQAGFRASGVEMSPWVVAYGKDTFGIDVQLGPIEAVDIPTGTLDVLAMMDVMEHLPDPLATMALCLKLLKPDGILLVQMPEFQEGMRFSALTKSKSPFLSQLKSDEHLYLYSKRATIEFFHRLGADHVQFEPAIFAHYDMFFVVSKSPLRTHDQQEIETALQASPGGRIALALLDMKAQCDRVSSSAIEGAGDAAKLQELYESADKLSNDRNYALAQLADLQRNFDAVEEDRIARGKVIKTQGKALAELQAQVHAHLDELNSLYPQLEELRNGSSSEAAKLQELYENADRLSNERNFALAQLADLQRNFDAVEQDRIARGKVIEAQGDAMAQLQAQVHARLDELNSLYPQLEELRNGSSFALAQLADLQRNFDAVEQDRVARGEVIEAQGDAIAQLQAQVHARLDELKSLYPQLEELRKGSSSEAAKLQELYEKADNLSNERNYALALLADLQRNFDAVEQDRIARGEVIEIQGAAVADLQAQVGARLDELNGLYERVDALSNERNQASAQLADLQRNFDAVEKDRIARGKVIEIQGAAVADLQAQVGARLDELNGLYERVDALSSERNQVSAQLADLQRNFDAVEQDRIARGNVIETQGAAIVDLQAQIGARLGELNGLYERVDALSNERNLVLAQLADLQRNFEAVEQDRIARGRVIETQGSTVADLQAQVGARLEELARLYESADALSNERNHAIAQLAEVRRNLDAVERDRVARGKVIETQGEAVSELQAQLHARLDELNALYPQVVELRHSCAERDAALLDLRGRLESADRDREARDEVIEEQKRAIAELRGELRQSLAQAADLRQELVRRNDEMAALERRWWWKLGTRFKAL